MHESIRIVFAGTPDFAVPALRALTETPHELVAVYTQPDRPRGRGRKLAASPVKQAARELAIPIEQPATLKSTEAVARLAGYAADLMVVVAYGLLLPEPVLLQPRLGCWNLHPSLLPRWRGAAPIQRTLMAGDTETGVCLMQMDAGLDTGAVLACERLAVQATDTAGSLQQSLAEIGAQLLKTALIELSHGELPVPVVQNESSASYAKKLTSDEAGLDWREPAVVLARNIRAMNPAPGARALLAGEKVKLWQADSLAGKGRPGAIVQAGREGIIVGTGDGLLRVINLQRPGKRALSAAEYLNGRPDLKTSERS